MKTSKPISTISYNSEEFLKAKLDYLVKNNTIEFWFYVKHLGEYDKETNIQDKDHIHLYIQCCDRVDTVKLREQFVEYENGDLNSKPLQCMPFQTSKPYDALLYDLHYQPYLLMKMETKQFSYTLDDVVTNDIDYLRHMYSEALHSDLFKRDRIMKLMDNGVSMAEMCFHGLINPSQAYQLAFYEQMFKKGQAEVASNGGVVSQAIAELQSPAIDVSKPVKKTTKKKTSSRLVSSDSVD